MQLDILDLNLPLRKRSRQQKFKTVVVHILNPISRVSALQHRENFLLTRHLREYLTIMVSLMHGQGDRIELDTE